MQVRLPYFDIHYSLSAGDHSCAIFGEKYDPVRKTCSCGRKKSCATPPKGI